MTTITPVIQVPTEDLKALFDIAVGSMDYGSGFLDTEEVEVLRRVAVAIGVDPMEATPDGMFAGQYPHAYAESVNRRPNAEPICARCGLAPDGPPHPKESP